MSWLRNKNSSSCSQYLLDRVKKKRARETDRNWPTRKYPFTRGGRRGEAAGDEIIVLRQRDQVRRAPFRLSFSRARRAGGKDAGRRVKDTRGGALNQFLFNYRKRVFSMRDSKMWLFPHFTSFWDHTDATECASARIIGVYLPISCTSRNRTLCGGGNESDKILRYQRNRQTRECLINSVR